MSSPISRADHQCCLSDLGSVNKPICKILKDKGIIMGKGKGSKEAKFSGLDDSEAIECSGKSILELVKDRMDEDIDEMMDEDAVENMSKKEFVALQAHASGLADAIAIMERPFLPNTAIVREEAMERYEERNS